MNVGIIAGVLDEKWGGGVSRYTIELIKNMGIAKPSNEYHLIHFNRDSPLDIYRDFKEIIVPPIKPFGGHVWKTYALPAALRLDGRIKCLDVVHNPAGTMSFPSRSKYKKVTTIHDLTYIVCPQFHASSGAGAKKRYEKTARRADWIIADSENTKNDAVKYLGADPSKISVIALGCDARFRPQDAPAKMDALKKYGIPSPFLLYVGTLEPRKNVPAIIRAYKILKERGTDRKLVIGGAKGWKYDEIFQMVSALGLGKDVIFTGRIDDSDLPALYGAADIFVYPSFYEGFGLPPLEAMACGCPVVTSNTSSLPEVIGDAGIMVEPGDISGLAERIGAAIADENLRKEMSRKGIERAKLFSWEKMAKETLDVYENMGDKK